MNITFRKAKKTDLDFITEGIILAEMSGSEILPYTALFGLDLDETRALILEALDEEIEGQEWYLPNFTILEADGQPAACLSAWVEGECGMGSGILKTQAMAWLLGEKWTQAGSKLEMLKSMQLPRLQLALQLECIYTKNEFRGKGMASKLIEYCIEHTATTSQKPTIAEIQLLGSNEAAFRSYTKCGFLIREQISSEQKEILTLLAHNTRLSLIKTL